MNAATLTLADKLYASWKRFRSICTCSHTGDGAGSEHHDLAVAGDGHGGCKHADCACSQFSWRRWTATYGEALHGILHTRRESVVRYK